MRLAMLTPYGTMHQTCNFAKPRKVPESLTAREPSPTYLEWRAALNSGKNVEIENLAIIFVHSCQEGNEFAFLPGGFDDPTTRGLGNQFRSNKEYRNREALE